MEPTLWYAQVSLPRDGIRIGKCNEGDIWPYCTSGCNDKSIGNDQCSDCQSGSMAGILIDCST